MPTSLQLTKRFVLWTTRRLGVWRELIRARRLSRQRLTKSSGRRLLVLCYGNIYRSPFVAALLKSVFGKDIEVRSAGFHSRSGREMPAGFREIAKKYGADLGDHRSMILDQSAADWADLIVIMDRHNWDALGRFGQRSRAKAIWLGAFLEDGPLEITDPYGRTVAEMEIIADRMHSATRILIEQLVHHPIRRVPISERGSRDKQ